MKLARFGATIVPVSIALITSLNITPSAVAASVKLFGLTADNTLLSFDPNQPTQTRRVGITGVDGTLLGIDFRPANGLLYGVTDTNNLYRIDTKTGAASFVSALSLSFNGGLQSGVDFNPVPDRLRLVGSNDQNIRVNVDTGAVADFDLNTPGTQPDRNLAYDTNDVNSGADPNVTAAAYTNAFPGPPSPVGVTPPTRSTQLFGIDSALDVLVRQDPPNNGTLTTIGSLDIDFGSTGGFDIFSTKNGDTITNTAYAASGSMLHTIDLATGKATSLGSIGDGSDSLVGLTATSVPEPGTIASLIGTGLFGLLTYRRRKSVA
jgi:hypothetical protein